MKKLWKASAALMLTAVMLFTAGCIPGEDPINDGDVTDPTQEGIYLGIIGFNQDLHEKSLTLLTSANMSRFEDFIDNLSAENGTGLYYADYTALNNLQSFGEPPKLTNVALVTFTDGLDNVSLSDDETNPNHYTSVSAYSSALNKRIRTEKVYGFNINAYTIGLKGNDVYDEQEFHNNLNMLASSEDNVYEVADMDEALERFSEIAESLHSVSNVTSLTMLLPGGYEDGKTIRFTFDSITSGENSALYIECTYKMTSDGRRLDNITYHGFESGAASLESVEKVGRYYKFAFINLTKFDGELVSEQDKNYLQIFRQVSSGSGWQPDSEFDKDNQSSVEEEQSSALIMLVLDCTTSLGDQFSAMKTGAKSFIETLVRSNGGSGGGNNGGGGNGTYNGHNYVDLGLPSGTLWATCNVGAYVPSGCGWYVAWGETSRKASYSWSTYNYCNGSETTLTKYCNNSSYGYNGFYDNLCHLESGDDLASEEWGDGWSIPTVEQWNELINHTSSVWLVQSSGTGRLFTASNGKSLFLPTTGYVENNQNFDINGCYYWSSDLSDNASCEAYRFSVYSGTPALYMASASRYYGIPVRAVCRP